MTPFEEVRERILLDLIALRDQLPHFSALSESNIIEGIRLDYENGRYSIPNPRYDQDLAHYNRITGMIADGESVKMKTRLIEPPKEIDAWNEEDGVRLRVQLFEDGFGTPLYSSMPEIYDEFGDLKLESYGDEFYAMVGNIAVNMIIEPQKSEIISAVGKVLQAHLPTAN